MRQVPVLLTMLTVLAIPPLAGQAPARAIPMLVSAEWVADRLGEPDLVVLQVDQRREGYAEGHIPGAVFLPYQQIAIEVDGLPVEMPMVDALEAAFEEAGVNDGNRIVVYGAPLSAARAWMTLDYLGLGDRVGMLDGGMSAWRAAGLSESTSDVDVSLGSLTVRPEPNRIVGADWILDRLDDPQTVLIDARPLDEYTGEDGGNEGRYLAGHIPGARHLYWEELTHSREDPRLLPEAELRTRFDAAGAASDRRIVVYCFIGMRASMAYFVSRLLEYDTYLYDGSWHDWSARDLPVQSGPDGLVGVRR